MKGLWKKCQRLQRIFFRKNPYAFYHDISTDFRAKKRSSSIQGSYINKGKARKKKESWTYSPWWKAGCQKMQKGKEKEENPANWHLIVNLAHQHIAKRHVQWLRVRAVILRIWPHLHKRVFKIRNRQQKGSLDNIKGLWLKCGLPDRRLISAPIEFI